MDASATVVARLSVQEGTARRLADLLAETYAAGEAAVAAFEEPGGAWSVEIYFGAAPDETALRDLVAAVAGEADASALTLTRVAAKDWVAASLAGLEPVPAGRFLVHGGHDRARVPPQRIGIEIEAALAFGTGHHGTTRGCLLALDRLLKRDLKPRRRRPAARGERTPADPASRGHARAHARYRHRHRRSRHRRGQGDPAPRRRQRYRRPVGRGRARQCALATTSAD